MLSHLRAYEESEKIPSWHVGKLRQKGQAGLEAAVTGSFQCGSSHMSGLGKNRAHFGSGEGKGCRRPACLVGGWAQTGSPWEEPLGAGPFPGPPALSPEASTLPTKGDLVPLPSPSTPPVSSLPSFPSRTSTCHIASTSQEVFNPHRSSGRWVGDPLPPPPNTLEASLKIERSPWEPGSPFLSLFPPLLPQEARFSNNCTGPSHLLLCLSAPSALPQASIWAPPPGAAGAPGFLQKERHKDKSLVQKRLKEATWGRFHWAMRAPPRPLWLGPPSSRLSEPEVWRFLCCPFQKSLLRPHQSHKWGGGNVRL